MSTIPLSIPKDSAWVVGFSKDLYPGNPTLGPYAGALYPRRVGALVRFSPVKGAKLTYVQRCPPASAEKADDESSDSEGEIEGFALNWRRAVGKRSWSNTSFFQVPQPKGFFAKAV